MSHATRMSSEGKGCIDRLLSLDNQLLNGEIMKPMKTALVVAVLAVIAPLSALANTDRPIGGAASKTTAADAQSTTTGVVKKVDFEQDKITISHGPIANLGMPAMTMVFRVADPSLLAAVRSDDKVNFVADKINGAFTVTSLIRAN